MTGERGASSETELEGQQPYRWPRGPLHDDKRRNLQRNVLIATAVLLFCALAVLLYVIITRRLL